MAKEIDREGFEAWLNKQRFLCMSIFEDEEIDQEQRDLSWFNAHVYEKVLNVLDMKIIDVSNIGLNELRELYALSYKFSDMREA